MGDFADLLEALKSGAPIIIPTDTVYGLAADPRVEGATQVVFDLKKRVRDKALPVLGDSIESLSEVAVFDQHAEGLAERFWPGPLTLVLPRRTGCSWDLGGTGETSVAVRVPDHSLTRALLKKSGALATTSANLSGHPATTDARAAAEAFGGSIGVLDGGPAARGRESTVLSLLGEPRLLRVGSLSADELGLQV